MTDTIQISRLDAVKLLYNMKHMKTLIEILTATESPAVQKTVAKAMMSNVPERHDGIEFHCLMND